MSKFSLPEVFSMRLRFVALIVLTCASAVAQTSFGSIVGEVQDASGAQIPAANVTVTNTGTSDRLQGATGANGQYQFVNLNPGVYKVEIEKPGFKRLVRDGVEVRVQNSVRVDATLEVGEQGQTVEVTAEAPLLQTENASMGQVVEGRAVADMPLNGRDVYNLIGLAAGVVPQGGAMGTGSLFAWANFQIAGGLPNQGKFIIDGAPVNGGYINNTAFAPVQDFIQEFQVQSTNLSPEFGGTLNGVVNLVTKGGSNQFHGTAFEYLRNRVLNANNFFSNKAGLATPAFTQNQFGGDVGGPAIRNKRFFFFGVERFTQRTGTTGSYTVPSPDFRGGTFSALKTVLYDPASTCTTCPAANLRMPFTGNIIPPSRFDNTARIMEKYWPLPNVAGASSTATNNYVTNYATGIDRHSYQLRIDQNISDRQRLFVRYTRWRHETPPSDPFYLGVSADFHQGADDTVLAYTFSISPTNILDLHVSYLRSFYARIPNTLGFDLTTIGWPSSYNSQFLQRQLPGLVVSGFSNSDVSAVLVKENADVGALSGSLTKILGRHTLKYGGEWSYMPTNYTQFGGGSNRFNFTTNFTSFNPLGTGATGPSGTGNAFASYLLGLGSSGNVVNINFPATMQKNAGLYLTDTFQISSRLTANYGIRWETPGYWTERHDLETVFLPGATNPVLQAAGLSYKGDVVLVNSDRYPNRHSQVPHWALFAPRAGLAYRPDQNMVIRAGFGLSYTPGTTVQNAAPYNAPINTATTPWVPTQDSGLTAVATLSNPFPNGILQPVGRGAAYEQNLLGTAVVMPIPNDKTPYVMNWNLDIQRQFRGALLLDVGYVGNRGVHLRMGGGGIVNGPGFNQIPSQYLSMGSALLNKVANPFAGKGNGTLAGSTIPAGQLLLPYPQYTGVNSPTEAAFDSIYHGLQVRAERRFKAGGRLTATYTWAKNLGNADTMTGFSDAYSPGVPQNYYNWSADRSLFTYDVPHRVTISYVLDAPFGKGRRFLSNVSGIADKLVSGWGINGVSTFQSGFPVPLLAQATSLSTNFNAGPPRPNVAAGCSKIIDGTAQSKVDKWFNTACFTQPDTFGFGSEPRTDPNIRTHGIANYDFAVFKRTTIRERVGIEFRTEFFNIFNRVQFAGPGNTLGTAQFGQVSSQLNQPRLIQVAGRLNF
jgi:hypothetical protein